MSDDLKERVLEIVSIAKECPENLQPLCFELLLRHYLEGRQRLPAAPPSPPSPPSPAEQPQAQGSIAAGETTTGQQDLKAGDLHVKVRKFMERHSITLDHLNQLFYKDAGEIKPLYEDLKTTRMAESQIGSSARKIGPHTGISLDPWAGTAAWSPTVANASIRACGKVPPLRRAIVVRSAGRTFKAAADGPLPLASMPWHVAQYISKRPRPYIDKITTGGFFAVD